MRPIEQTIRDQLKIRPRVLGFSLFALVSLLMTPVFGDAGEQEIVLYHVLSDDISNQVHALPGSDTSGDGSSGGGHDNNGHGNNQDGVDSSNPGQGHGGPNGGQDDSCSGSDDCVDDEGGNGH